MLDPIEVQNAREYLKHRLEEQEQFVLSQELFDFAAIRLVGMIKRSAMMILPKGESPPDLTGSYHYEFLGRSTDGRRLEYYATRSEDDPEKLDEIIYLWG